MVIESVEFPPWRMVILCSYVELPKGIWCFFEGTKRDPYNVKQLQLHNTGLVDDNVPSQLYVIQL